MPLTTETALLSCIKQAREDVLTLRHLQLLQAELEDEASDQTEDGR